MQHSRNTRPATLCPQPTLTPSLPRPLYSKPWPHPAGLPHGAASAGGQPGHACELVKLAIREPKQLAEQAQQALAQKAWLRAVPPPQKPHTPSGAGANAGQQQQLSAVPPWATPPADAQVR